MKARNNLARPFSRLWRPVPILIFFLGVLSAIVILLTALFNDERQRSHFLMNDAILELRLHATMAHLWLEEALEAGPDHIDIHDVIDNYDKSIGLSEVILNGGETHHGPIVLSLTDPRMRSELDRIRTILNNLKIFAVDRLRNRETGGIGSDDDKRYNVMFRDLDKRADSFELIVDKMHMSKIRQWRIFFWVMLFGWTFVVLFASVALWNREDRRERAERALEMAREEFDIRVRERTAELSRANELLQQELAEHRRLSPPPPGP